MRTQTRQAIQRGVTLAKKFTCPFCAARGKQVLFKNQTEFGKHLREAHTRYLRG